MTTYNPEAGLFAARNQMRIYAVVLKAIVNDCAKKGLTRTEHTKQIAKKLGVRPQLISFWLQGPDNLNLNNISDLLFAIDCELDFKVVDILSGLWDDLRGRAPDATGLREVFIRRLREE